MARRRPDLEAARRQAERRERESHAGKLTEAVPRLAKLRLMIDEELDDQALSAARHVRHIVVEHAPALFEIPCTSPECHDGGHDLTTPILRALRDNSEEFAGEDACTSPACRRVLRYVGHAEFVDGATAKK